MSVASDIAFQRADTVRVSRRTNSGVRAALLPRSIRGRRSGPCKYPFRSSIQSLSTWFTRLLTFVSSCQRVSLPGRWLAVTLGRICTFWMTSAGFIELPSRIPTATGLTRRDGPWYVHSKECAACYTSFVSRGAWLLMRRGSDSFRPWHFSGFCSPRGS